MCPYDQLSMNCYRQGPSTEACDDGNVLAVSSGKTQGLNHTSEASNEAGDGCDPSCQVELGWRTKVQAGRGQRSAELLPVPNHPWQTNTTQLLLEPVCGDGLVVRSEGCDDGNLDLPLERTSHAADWRSCNPTGPRRWLQQHLPSGCILSCTLTRCFGRLVKQFSFPGMPSKPVNAEELGFACDPFDALTKPEASTPESGHWSEYLFCQAR